MGSERRQWARGKFFGGPSTFYSLQASQRQHFSKFSELVGCLFILFIAKKRLRLYNELVCFILGKMLRIFLMTTMTGATYLQGRWKLSEDKANVKVIVRIWSLTTNAAYSSNSMVSMSTWIRGTYTCFINYNIDTQITTLLTSSLALDTKFTMSLQYHSWTTFADI